MRRMTSREVRLAQRPVGEPVPEDFELADSSWASRTTGRRSCATSFMSVDPYMRGRMNDARSYVAALRARQGDVRRRGRARWWRRGEPGSPRALVLHQLGWREAALLERHGAQRASLPAGCRRARCWARSGCRG